MGNDIDTKLLGLGFTNVEIQNLRYIANMGGKFTTACLQGQFGYNYAQAKRLIYAYNISIGKIVINTEQDMVRHLKRMFGENTKITLQDLAISKISDVPRLAVVRGITAKPYDIWNSGNTNKLYKVIDSNANTITIETSIKPKIEYGAVKNIVGMIEVKGVMADNGRAVVSINRRFCRLCNRFVIVASLKRPEFHLGLFEIICFEGTRVYVFAINMGTAEHVRYREGTQRVYDYGVFEKDIEQKLSSAAKTLYSHLHGVKVQHENANSKYTLLNKDNPLDDEAEILQ